MSNPTRTLSVGAARRIADVVDWEQCSRMGDIGVANLERFTQGQLVARLHALR